MKCARQGIRLLLGGVHAQPMFEMVRVGLDEKIGLDNIFENLEDALAKARERGTTLEGLKIQITQKAGPDGRLFGSVTNYDVVEALQKQGQEVERANVRMPQGPLKQVGDVPIQIALHTDVTVTITVSVLGEQ